MSLYSKKDWADPDKPTPKELSLWLTADPIRGLRLIRIQQAEFATVKATLNPAQCKKQSARLREDAHKTACFMLSHIFDMAESLPNHPSLSQRNPDAMPKCIEAVSALLKLASNYLPHVMMPERARWRTLIRQATTLTGDMVALLRSEVTHKPLPPEAQRRWDQYNAALDSEKQIHPPRA